MADRRRAGVPLLRRPGAIGQGEPARDAAYVGTYELSKESERRTTISLEGGQLFLERTGGKKTPLYPEVRDLFFRKATEGRLLFHFGADGKVDTLIDRRNNEDVIWKRIA